MEKPWGRSAFAAFYAQHGISCKQIEFESEKNCGFFLQEKQHRNFSDFLCPL